MINFGQKIIDTLVHAQPAISPVAVGLAVAGILSTITVIAPLIGPGIALFLWQSLRGLLGFLPKRKKTWGTVYDARTKRPIPFAKVQLLDRSRRVLETRIADRDGRYGFLTTPESLIARNVEITLLPSQNGYAFPSKLSASVDTFVYNNLYYGTMIRVDDRTLINFDIPMDPLQPSHNLLIVSSPSIAFGITVAIVADAGFWLGLIMVPLNFILMPNPFTFGTLCLFLGTASLRLFGLSEHPFGTVTDAVTGKAMPFALITLNDLSGRRIAFAVSDERGRYFMVVERGRYELNVVTSASVGHQRQQRIVIDTKKGWITRQISL